MSLAFRIHESGLAEIDARSSELAALLIDAVDGGASIGFLAPLAVHEAIRYWTSVSESLTCITLVAESGRKIVGSVQLELCDRTDGDHRAELMKLMVHRGARRQGIGRALVKGAEQAALNQGRTLLVLDTRGGDPSESLYLSMGYTAVGCIPRYARSSDGKSHDTTVYYKELTAHSPE